MIEVTSFNKTNLFDGFVSESSHGNIRSTEVYQLSFHYEDSAYYNNAVVFIANYETEDCRKIKVVTKVYLMKYRSKYSPKFELNELTDMESLSEIKQYVKEYFKCKKKSLV